MGLFDIFRRRDTDTDSNDQVVVDDVLLKALLGDEKITREQAMTLPAVSGAVDYISNTIASMPIKLYKRKGDKIVEASDDQRVVMLNGDTKDTLDGFQLKKAMVDDFLLGKGGYCYIRKSLNNVTGLFYVQDSKIAIVKNTDPIIKSYRIQIEGKEYKPYEFIKLLRNTKDGACGTGVVEEVGKAIETAYRTMLYQLKLAKSGGSKKGFLKSTRKLGQAEIDTLKQAWRKMYETNTENVVVLNNGIEFQEASATSSEMQLNENKNTLRSEINSVFHIYEGDFNTTFKLAIYPIIKAFETALNRDLLLEKEKKNFFFQFDVTETIKASVLERYQAYQIAKNTGFMTINEIRELENMETVDGLDVINVGLGAVLYDINTHKYYTPNTDTVGDPSDNETPQDKDETPQDKDETIQNPIEDSEAEVVVVSGDDSDKGGESG